MRTHKTSPLFRFFAHNNAARMFQHCAKQRTNSSRACSYNKDCIVRRNLRDTRCPKSGSQNIPYKQSLFVGHSIRNPVQSLICMGHTYILGLSSVNATAQSPSSIRILTIIYISFLTEKALATECFHIHRYPIARLNRSNSGTYLLNNAYHLMPHRNARNSTGNTSMLDMQITGTDTSERDTYQGITRIL